MFCILFGLLSFIISQFEITGEDLVKRKVNQDSKAKSGTRTAYNDKRKTPKSKIN